MYLSSSEVNTSIYDTYPDFDTLFSNSKVEFNNASDPSSNLKLHGYNDAESIEIGGDENPSQVVIFTRK